MKIVSVESPKWADVANTCINCLVVFEEIGSAIPFTSSASDATPHGRELFERIVDGDFGPIAAFDLPSFGEQRATKLSDLANRRWQAETGGIVVAGMSVPTDDKTQSRVTAAYVKAAQDSEFAIPNWKFAPGVWGALDAATIIAIGDAITAHVQACFSNEAAISALIVAAADHSALDAIDINTGWPS
tara:strand:+ start:29882 stop:30442 length:561 start_codon:yes stop_codon:yes gene_type:complete